MHRAHNGHNGRFRLITMLILVLLAKLGGGYFAGVIDVPGGGSTRSTHATVDAPLSAGYPLTPIGMLGRRISRWLHRVATAGRRHEVVLSEDRPGHPPR